MENWKVIGGYRRIGYRFCVLGRRFIPRGNWYLRNIRNIPITLLGLELILRLLGKVTPVGTSRRTPETITAAVQFAY